MKRLWWLWCFLLAFGRLPAQGKIYRVWLRADRDTAIVGDVVHLTAEVEYDESLNIRGGLQAFAHPSLDPVGSVEVAQTDTLVGGRYHNIRIEQLAAMVMLDSGLIVVPGVKFFSDASGDTLMTRPVKIFVKPVLSVKDPPRPIKTIIREPKRADDYLPWIIGAVALLMLVLLILYLRKHRPEPIPSPPEVEEKYSSPKEEALMELGWILSSRLWEKDPKEAQLKMSRILRRFLKAKYGIPALEMTSSELSRSLHKQLRTRQRLALMRLLRDADMVKFAKLTMPADRHRQSIEQAIAWVKDVY